MLEIVADSRPWRRNPHSCKSLRNNTELVARQLTASKDVDMEAEASTALGVLPGDKR
jgi:hypothetical protein